MWDEAPARADDRRLRQFAATLTILAAASAVTGWWRRGSLPPANAIVLTLAIVQGVVGVIAPAAIAWLYGLAMAITRPIGRVVSELMLFVLYFAVVTPIAVVSRLVRRDRMERRIDRSAPSYWTPHRGAQSIDEYFRQS